MSSTKTTGRVRDDEKRHKKLKSSQYSIVNTPSKLVEPPADAFPGLSKDAASQTSVLPNDMMDLFVSTLLNSNCSVEFIDKFTEFLGCLRYFLSLKTDNKNTAEPSKAPKNSSKKSSNNNITSDSPWDMVNVFFTMITNHDCTIELIDKFTSFLSSLKNLRTHKLAGENNNVLSEADSEPHRSVRRVIRTRRARTERHKQRLRKTFSSERSESRPGRVNNDSDDANVIKKQKISPRATPQQRDESPAKSSASKCSEASSAIFDYHLQSSARQEDTFVAGGDLDIVSASESSIEAEKISQSKRPTRLSRLTTANKIRNLFFNDSSGSISEDEKLPANDDKENGDISLHAEEEFPDKKREIDDAQSKITPKQSAKPVVASNAPVNFTLVKTYMQTRAKSVVSPSAASEESKSPQNGSVNSAVASQGMTTSSRGRRIMRPLCYWEGERVSMTGAYNPRPFIESISSVSPKQNPDNSSIRKNTRAKMRAKSAPRSSKPVEDASTKENRAETSQEKDTSAIETPVGRRNQHLPVKRRLEEDFESNNDTVDTNNTSSCTTKKQMYAAHVSDGDTEKNETAEHAINTLVIKEKKN